MKKLSHKTQMLVPLLILFGLLPTFVTLAMWHSGENTNNNWMWLDPLWAIISWSHAWLFIKLDSYDGDN